MTITLYWKSDGTLQKAKPDVVKQFPVFSEQDIWDKLIDIGFWQIENLPAGRGIVVHDDETLATFSGEKFCILI